MATATLPQNRDRVWRKIVARIQASTVEADRSVGNAGTGRIKRRCWVCAGTPSGAIPTGMLALDLILDTTNDKVYRYITGTTYVEVTATS